MILLFAIPSAASDKIIKLQGPAPTLLLTLNNSKEFGDGVARTSGPHGLMRECFQSKGCFLILEQNVVGEGYEITNTKPIDFNELQCLLINERPENMLGLTIGTSKSIVESKLGVKISGSNETIQWYSKKMIGDKQFDVQTTTEFEFTDSKLTRIWVFTTTTY